MNTMTNGRQNKKIAAESLLQVQPIYAELTVNLLLLIDLLQTTTVVS